MKARPPAPPKLGSLSLGAIARAAGLSTSHLSLVFSGRRNPSVATARSIARVLDCNMDALMDYLDWVKQNHGDHKSARRVKS